MILLISLTLFAGCFSQPKELDESGKIPDNVSPWRTPSESEKPVYDIVDKSLEGERMTLLKRNFSNDDYCTKEKFVERMKKVYETYPDQLYVYVTGEQNFYELKFDFSEEEMQRIDEAIKALKECDFDVKREDKEDEEKFVINYYIQIKGNCGGATGYGTDVDYKQLTTSIEVYPKRNSYNVVEDVMARTNSEDELVRMFGTYEIMGECLEAWMTGTPKVVFSQHYIDSVNYPRQCTQTGGQLLIKDYYLSSDLILLMIQNATPNDITIESITGSPNELTWDKAMPELLKSETGSFSLRGSFPEQLNEKITITYNQNGLTKSEKTTCSGKI
ncbi:MAG: hypothetical protein ABIJ74_00510 [archaeon]